jgi:hypothetical protein
LGAEKKNQTALLGLRDRNKSMGLSNTQRWGCKEKEANPKVEKSGVLVDKDETMLIVFMKTHRKHPVVLIDGLCLVSSRFICGA